MQLTLWGEFVNDPGSMLEQEFTAGKHPIVAVRTFFESQSCIVHPIPPSEACPETPLRLYSVTWQLRFN